MTNDSRDFQFLPCNGRHSPNRMCCAIINSNKMSANSHSALPFFHLIRNTLHSLIRLLKEISATGGTITSECSMHTRTHVLSCILHMQCARIANKKCRYQTSSATTTKTRLEKMKKGDGCTSVTMRKKNQIHAQFQLFILFVTQYSMHSSMPSRACACSANER